MKTEEHELVEELHHRLDNLCRCTASIADATGEPEVQKTLREVQRQEEETVHLLKQKINDRLDHGVYQEEL